MLRRRGLWTFRCFVDWACIVTGTLGLRETAASCDGEDETFSDVSKTLV